MKTKLFTRLSTNSDSLMVTDITAMLTLRPSHKEAIKRALSFTHKHPKAVTTIIDLSNPAFGAKPSFAPLEEHLKEEFSKPTDIVARIHHKGKEMEIAVTFGDYDQGIWFQNTYYSDTIKIPDTANAIVADEGFRDWILEEPENATSVKDAVGQGTFNKILQAAGIKEEDIEQ